MQTCAPRTSSSHPEHGGILGKLIALLLLVAIAGAGWWWFMGRYTLPDEAPAPGKPPRVKPGYTILREGARPNLLQQTGEPPGTLTQGPLPTRSRATRPGRRDRRDHGGHPHRTPGAGRGVGRDQRRLTRLRTTSVPASPQPPIPSALLRRFS